MNFTFTPGEDNYVAIYDANGISLIDEIVIPGDLKPGQSYARKVDGEGGTGNPDAWEVRDGSNEKYITPSSNNIIKSTNSKVDMFAEQDARGGGMAIMAMCIVFTALLVLAICFNIINKLGATTPPSLPHPPSILTLMTVKTPCSPSIRCARHILLGAPRYTDSANYPVVNPLQPIQS